MIETSAAFSFAVQAKIGLEISIFFPKFEVAFLISDQQGV